ncbi:uncharacterized protein EI97DRAFT_457397 [Westerdykella ornata]|uniref:Uncharacterized protein n=1 Tax=Westerdykella ornata TaxID=318751 RepID=A0A6A6JL36_WESOR|nr:uncharacterized protein EI97DRAFT_457397 [Westerdykella ornata]KAF2277370.1 hypothetical protein EI97DRAFT_457397 [Westerdykella ornata]
MRSPADSADFAELSRTTDDDWDTIVEELKKRDADHLLGKFPDVENLEFVEHCDFKDNEGRNFLPYKLRLWRSETESNWVYMNYFDKKAATLTFIQEYASVEDGTSELRQEIVEGYAVGDLSMDEPLRAIQRIDDGDARKQPLRAVIKALFVAGGVITAERLLEHGSGLFYKQLISGLRVLNGLHPTIVAGRRTRREHVEDESRTESQRRVDNTEAEVPVESIDQPRRSKRAPRRFIETTPRKSRLVRIRLPNAGATRLERNASEVRDTESSYTESLGNVDQNSEMSGSDSCGSDLVNAEEVLHDLEITMRENETRLPEPRTNNHRRGGPLPEEDDEVPEEQYQHLRKLYLRKLDIARANKRIKHQLKMAQEQSKILDDLEATVTAAFDTESKGLRGSQMVKFTFRLSKSSGDDATSV